MPPAQRAAGSQGWRQDVRAGDAGRLAARLRLWSQRIDDEHRLVYGATDDELIIIQARYHYDD